MPVPSLLTDLSSVPGDNSPQGGESVFPSLDDYLRTISAFIAQLDSAKAALTGSNATGTWPISITGAATAAPWTGITGRPTNVSSFANDAGYVTSVGAAAAGSLTGGVMAANVTASSLLSVGSVLATVLAGAGSVRMNSGNSTRGGYVELFGPGGGPRQAYIGFALSGGAIPLECETGGGWNFSGGLVSSVGGFSGSLTGNASTATSASSATTAASVAWTGVSGRPTSLAAFTNDPGYVTSTGTVAAANSAASVSGATSNGFGTRTVSTAAPSGVPADGAIWLQYTP